LQAINLLGVDYIVGHAESTGGLLWVVGKDPDLFNYFLPERWRRTPKRKLSKLNQVYYTRTKDSINLVWKVSRMGEVPSANLPAAIAHGFNSPFEEFAVALELSRRGVNTVYPRAIYMTGRAQKSEQETSDERRYQAQAALRCPDGDPAVRKGCDYITIWGYWNGPDTLLAEHDGRYYRAINAKRACTTKLITPALRDQLLAVQRAHLASCGFEDLNLKADHLLISYDSAQNLVCDSTGKPELRLCNFELVRRLP
jgi:hypothetical protein